MQYAAPWVAEARAGGHHEARESYIGRDDIGRDGNHRGEVDVVPDPLEW